ncbi:hypothetical protein CLV62_12031 [Dysgonomonas alginatilytica]|uniref:Uncharacterized protein n=1 Tax=Dysgonomonas alginatilytica TaxID=1605892 RepID=A0A2V3PN87_9BACT|nr:hypothetical protein [Dysgonomonas alginatilytica]PXV62343.1 hypothetical protein CLV62_12031 [Dysgonomonas alginatilytica]
MKNNRLTFEEAYEYLYRRRKELNLVKVAPLIGIARTQLSACLNGTKDKDGKPNKLPKKHQAGVIRYVLSTQISAIFQDAE